MQNATIEDTGFRMWKRTGNGVVTFDGVRPISILGQSLRLTRECDSLSRNTKLHQLPLARPIGAVSRINQGCYSRLVARWSFRKGFVCWEIDRGARSFVLIKQLSRRYSYKHKKAPAKKLPANASMGALNMGFCAETGIFGTAYNQTWLAAGAMVHGPVADWL